MDASELAEPSMHCVRYQEGERTFTTSGGDWASTLS